MVPSTSVFKQENIECVGDFSLFKILVLKRNVKYTSYWNVLCKFKEKWLRWSEKFIHIFFLFK